MNPLQKLFLYHEKKKPKKKKRPAPTRKKDMPNRGMTNRG